VADFITKKFFEQTDFAAMYSNGLACCNPQSCQIPVIMATEEAAISAAVASCQFINYDAPRIVRIKNTLAIDEFWISESLIDEAVKIANVEILQ